MPSITAISVAVPFPMSDGLGQPGVSRAASGSGGGVASVTSFPPPPVFGFSRDDSINLEDIFADWFNEDNLNGPPPAMGNSNEPGPAVLPQEAYAPAPAQKQQPGAAAAAAAAVGGKQALMMMPVKPSGGATLLNGGDGGGCKTSGSAAAGDKEEEEYDDEYEDDYGEDGAESTVSSTGAGGGGGGGGGGAGRKKRPRGAGGGSGGSMTGMSGRRMTEEQKVERRERNREHAKRSRVRKKFLLESLQKSVNALQEENNKLRGAIRSHLKDGADELLKTCEVEPEDSLLTSDPSTATKILDDPDYTLVKALQTAQQNFVITDPTLPDNPIVYASGGFLNLTGYQMDQILGRNCRFLQGPDTDPAAVDKIRRAIEEGTDGSVCLLNYRADGSTFWNQFFIAALRGADGGIVNYVGVQCRVSEEYAREGK